MTSAAVKVPVILAGGGGQAGGRRPAEVDVGLLYRGREITVRQLVVDCCAAAFEFDNLCCKLPARVAIDGQRRLFVAGEVSLELLGGDRSNDRGQQRCSENS